MFITLLLAIGAIALFLYYWVESYNYWKKKGFPHLPGTFPYGTKKDMALMARYQGKTHEEIYNELAPLPYGGLYIWKRPYLLVRDPEIIRAIMTKEFVHFRDRAWIEVTEKDVLSQHIFNLDGDFWRPIRTKLTPTFTSGRLKSMFSLFETCAALLDKSLDKAATNPESVDVKLIATCFTLDVISTCAFGLDANSADEKNEEFRRNARYIFTPYVRLDIKLKAALYGILPFFSKFHTFHITEGRVTRFVTRLIKDTVKFREQNGIKRNDFLDLMIELKNKGVLDGDKKDPFTEKQNVEMTPELMAAQCFVFFAAGFETSSSVQSYSMYELALNPDVQERLRKEVDEVKKLHGDITYKSLQEMPYMDQVISEVLRKYPTLPILYRRCTKSFVMPDRPDLVIDEGIRILIPIYALHRDPKYFPDPEKFDPERFSPENKGSFPQYAYIPFGEGPRHCIGMRFGLLQTKMGLCTILSKYKVMPAEDTPRPIKFVATNLISTTEGPIKLLIRHRDDLK